MGGAILGGQSNSTRGLQVPRDQWCNLPQPVEHRTTKEILSLVFPFVFAFSFSNSLSLSFFRHEEEDGKVMTDCVGGFKGAQG
jgi:hypothetical protein